MYTDSPPPSRWRPSLKRSNTSLPHVTDGGEIRGDNCHADWLVSVPKFPSHVGGADHEASGLWWRVFPPGSAVDLTTGIAGGRHKWA